MEKKDKESVLKNIVRYSSSNVYQQFLGVLSAFIKPKLLSPEMYGLWNLLTIITNYATYSNLGTHNMMRYVIPYHETRNENQKSREIKSAIFYGVLFINLVIVTLLAIYSFRSELSLPVRLGVLTMAFLVIAEWYYDYYINVLKAYQKFSLVSSVFFIKATVAFIFSVVLIYFFKIYGVFLSAILTFVFIILYLRLKFRLEPHQSFQSGTFLDMAKKGLPLTAYTLMESLINSSDKIIIAYFLGTEQLGYYGIAVMVFSFIRRVPGSSREVIEPRLMQSLGMKNMGDTLQEYLLKPLINSAYYLPFLIGPAVFILPVFITLLLPRYIPGIVPAQIILIGSYFVALTYITRGAIVANDWQLRAALVMCSALIVGIVVNVAILKNGFGIKGVAVGSSISFLFQFLIILRFIRSRCSDIQLPWKQTLTGLCWPFPFMCIMIILLMNLPSIIPLNIYVAPFINCIIFCVVMLFIIKMAAMRYELLEFIDFRKIWQKNKI